MERLIFSRPRTLTPGGHLGGGITVAVRGDGILVRVSQGGRWLEVFLDTDATDDLVERLSENPTAWGWQPREGLAALQQQQRNALDET